ncbi:MAG: MFS transporter, partial [Candidatus Latescibacterota bacterium]
MGHRRTPSPARSCRDRAASIRCRRRRRSRIYRGAMGRNVQVLLLVSILFGVAGGIYEFVLPYYLEGRGLSFMNMGYVFAASTLAMFVVRLGLGNLADQWGSKRLYVA